jgi:hypothetical protein
MGTACAQCHSTASWGDVAVTGFDHDRAAFKLTGKHRAVDCKACHVDQVFRGTPQTCVGCHAEPQVHKGTFGTACAQCHSTTTWKGATFKHAFPINHGRERNRGANACGTCHAEAPNFQTYTCYGCHAHQPAAMARKHPRLTAVQLQACATCHRGGRGGGREGRAVGWDDGPTPEGAGCPAAAARADRPCGRCADNAGAEDRFLVLERLAARRASCVAERTCDGPPAPVLAWRRGEPWSDGLGPPGVDLSAPGRRRPSQGLRARRRRFGLVGTAPGR